MDFLIAQRYDYESSTIRKSVFYWVRSNLNLVWTLRKFSKKNLIFVKIMTSSSIFTRNIFENTIFSQKNTFAVIDIQWLVSIPATWAI